MNASFTLVLGGASSGKSAIAEQIVTRTGRARVYLATAQAFDSEMKQKIADHQRQRGDDWLTLETPLDPAAAITERQAKEIVLLDCATLWLTNIMLADRDIAAESARLLDALAARPCPVVVVSNEVGQGIVPDNALARRFRTAQGRLNQQLAAACDTAVFVTAGLPQVLKGAL